MTLRTAFETCEIALSQGNLSTCEPLGLSLADWAAIITLAAAIFWGVLRFLRLPLLRMMKGSSEQDFWTFRGLRMALRPLVLDNKRIFETFGPKSGADDVDLQDFDLATWHRVRLDIKDNNTKLGAFIRSNSAVIPKKHGGKFQQWLNHIDAFSAHLNDQKVDYRNHQYPDDIDDLLGIRNAK